MIGIPADPYLIGAVVIGALVCYFELVRYWPQIKAKLPGIEKELDREHADLDNFVKNAYANIDKQIADLQAKKQRVAETVGAVKKLVQ